MKTIKITRVLTTAVAIFLLPLTRAIAQDAYDATSGAWAEFEHGAFIEADKDDEAGIRLLLKNYATALKAGSARQVTALYTKHGLVLAPGAPVAEGNKAVEKYFENTFKAIGLDLEFTIREIKVIKDKYAIVCSTSKGTVTVHANNKAKQDSFKELFVMKKKDGNWKITHYAFNQGHWSSDIEKDLLNS